MNYVKSRAQVEEPYRYSLWRLWDETLPQILFIGLNPSTANATKDDRTVSRCVNLAKQWGYGGISIGNLFAYQSENPEEMMNHSEPIGPENDKWLKRLADDSDLIVAMWGDGGLHMNRAETVLRMFPDLYCIATTQAGQPRHPRGALTPSKPIRFMRK